MNIENTNCTMKDHGDELAVAACCRPSDPAFMGETQSNNFWKDRGTWKKAGANTFNCLIGCSIGDFGTIIYLTYHYPEMSIFLQMALAMTMGLITSIIFESIILKIKEGFAWGPAVKMAFTMSFISMLGMEFAENITDYLLTGGNIPITDPWFWGALGISLIAGFITPLPYNYYKLAKYGKACH